MVASPFTLVLRTLAPQPVSASPATAATQIGRIMRAFYRAGRARKCGWTSAGGRGLALLLLLCAPARAEVTGALRLIASTGVDTNARRDFDQVPGGAASDLVASLLAQGSLKLQGDRAQLVGSYDVGVRKF